MSDPSVTVPAKVRWRLGIPFIILVLVSSLDRVNISFAAVRMKAELGLSEADYGFGAGIFFLGFLTAQVPSVLLMKKLGMRLWLTLVVLAWGLAATCMAFVSSAAMFYGLRVALGLAEAGLVAGIVLYLNGWTSERDRNSSFSLPMLAIPISVVVGAPISGWILGLSNPVGLADWRWMFLAEGAPTLILALFCFFYFPNSPAGARWLTPVEKTWIDDNALLGGKALKNQAPGELGRALRNPFVWACGLLWYLLLAGAYGIIFYLPQVVHQMSGMNDLEIGFVTALPWVGNVIGIVLGSSSSDRTGERYWHVAVPAFTAAVAFVGAFMVPVGWPALALLFIGGMGLGAAQGAFWAVPTNLMPTGALTIGVTLVNIAGSTSGLVTPNIISQIRQATGSFSYPIYLVGAFLAVAAILVLLIGRFGPRVRTAGA